jgi:ketosteroid isomerase-like protein
MVGKLCVFALVVLVPSFAAAQTADARAKQIEAMERAINVAVQKGDLNAFKANIADDAVSLDGSGPMGIAEFYKMFNQIKLTTFSIDKANVKFLNDTTAVITDVFTGEGSFMGQKMPSPVWASTTYVNRAGKWLAVFHQENAGHAAASAGQEVATAEHHGDGPRSSPGPFSRASRADLMLRGQY